MKYSKSGLWKSIISSPITLVVIIFIFIFLVRAVWNMNDRLNSSLSKLETANAELKKLEDHQNSLTNKIKYLSTDQGIEAELRTKYRAIREGESVAVIVENDQTANVSQFASSSDDLSSQKMTKKGWFGRLLQFVGL